MFNFFKKKEVKKEITFNYDSLMVDMHSHVLPGIDDGAQTPQESIALIRAMIDMGIKKVIATPHIMADYYKNTPESINNALTILKAELEKEGIAIPVEAAAEHYFDETFEARIEQDNLMIIGKNYVLFEFSFISLPPNHIAVLQKIRDKGYKPILAHPERYAYLSLDQLKMLHDWGCDFQLNTISLTGYYGAGVKKQAELLVDSQLIDFISSDMHNLKHANALKDALRTTYIEKLLFDYPLKNTLLFK